MRQKPRASVVVATNLVKQGQADVMVSMGSTGSLHGERRADPGS